MHSLLFGDAAHQSEKKKLTDRPKKTWESRGTVGQLTLDQHMEVRIPRDNPSHQGRVDHYVGTQRGHNTDTFWTQKRTIQYH